MTEAPVLRHPDFYKAFEISCDASGVGGSSGVARNQAPTDDGGNVQRTPMISNQQPRTTGGIMCFRCGEVGHRQSECKTVGKKVLIAETNEEDVAKIGDEPQFNDEEMIVEDLVEGDVGPLLMVRPALVTIDDKFTPDKVEEKCHSAATANKETSLCIGDHSASSLEVLNSGDIADKHGAAMVKPMSANTFITLLYKLGVKEPDNPEERVVELGVDEGLQLLKASIESRTLLTSVFPGNTGA
ncbi:hypothetical protein LWI28_017907 [Acer negundo]|uniref:CCHC-type domain-containing protein n=1 Tax=Acer negundo TaxID=4023 RepID=A0AAD5NGZ0_ACENE|nr:hypothetical protein LWI28_017907 [Acer negundo]